MRNIEEVKIQLINNSSIDYDLMNDFDVNSFDKHGNNILHYYVKNSDSININSQDLIKMFLDKGIDINSLQNKSPKSSALHLAVKLKKRNIVELLLASNAKVDIIDEDGNTPLWQAVMGYKNDDPFYIEFLKSKGADKNIENVHGVSPLSLSGVIANYDSKSLL